MKPTWQPWTVALAVATVIAGCSSDPEPGPSTAPIPTATTSAAPSSATTTPLTTNAPSPAPAATTTTTVPPPDALPGWDSWTLIYASLDTTTSERDDAAAIAATINDAAVLLSDDYPSLNPGYWVVYAGEWHDRHIASVWCPRPLDPALSCYPRYLGESVPDLLADGAALVQLGPELVVIDPADGQRLATFSDNFYNEAAYPARFSLDRATGALFFSLGFEDSWYSCDSDKGQIRRLDLDSGTDEVFADGWSPSISPDGRWLALVAAADCYPDPEVDGWVITPGSQVEVFDLQSASSTPAYVLRTETPPSSYEDEQRVLDVLWDPAVPGDLLVALGDNSMRRVSYDSFVLLDNARIDFSTGDPYLAAVTTGSEFFLSYYEDRFVVTEVDRSSGEIVATRELDGWWTTIAVNARDEVLIGATDLLILPSGLEVPIEGDVHNLAW